MSDAEARQAERAAAQGDPAGEADLLVARMRAGALQRERVNLAARLGDPAAQIVLGSADQGPSIDLHDLDREGRVRVMIAGANAAVDSEREDGWFAPDVLVLRALEHWALDPDPERVHPLQRAVERVRWEPRIPEELRNLIQAASHAIQRVSGSPPLQFPAATFDAIANEVIPWALGSADPVAARARIRSERAPLAWNERAFQECGCLIYERLAPARRVHWAIGVHELCLQRVPATPEFDHLLDLAQDPEAWRQGHAAFSAVRALTLEADRNPDSVDPVFGAVLMVAENTAKVIYNASGEPAPFDHNSGWKLPGCAWHVADRVGSAEFTAGIESALLEFA